MRNHRDPSAQMNSCLTFNCLMKTIMRMRSKMKISRRRLLPLAGGVLAASALPRLTWGGKGFPVGIQLYTVSADLAKDPAGTLKKIAQIGYNEVEPAMFGGITAAQLRDFLRDTGLRVPSVHLFLFGLQDTGKLLEDANTLGVEYAVASGISPDNAPTIDIKDPKSMLAFFKFSENMSADDYRNIAAKANKFGQQVKSAGLNFALHNHNSEFKEFGGGKTGYDIFLEDTDPSLVKFEADCGWMKVAGKNPVNYLTRYRGRYMALHVKDFKNLTKPVTSMSGMMGPDAPISTELGRGDIDLKAIVQAGLKTGVKHMYVEQEPPFKDVPALEAAEIDYHVLKSLLS